MRGHAARLPGRPHPVDTQQTALTARHLAPAEPAIIDWLRALRGTADAGLKPRLPDFAGKPYPLGRCKEIRNTVATHLQAAVQAAPAADDHEGLRALRRFIGAGGAFRLIWGDLRGQYFQNAMQFGGWYIDVANDTVVSSKPPVEILPLADSGYTPILDYAHFCRIARGYWQAEIVANTVFPALAPYLPLVCVNEQGGIWLAAAFDEMIEATRASGFALSERILAELPPADAAMAARLRARHGTTGPFLAPVGDALTCCRQYRAQAAHHDPAHRDAAVLAYIGDGASA